MHAPQVESPLWKATRRRRWFMMRAAGRDAAHQLLRAKLPTQEGKNAPHLRDLPVRVSAASGRADTLRAWSRTSA